MLNRCTFIGRFTRDIEVKTSTNGKRYCQFTLAVDRGKDANGNNLGADFIPCSAWEGKAQLLQTYCHQGDPILVSGRLNVSKKGDKYYYSVVVADIEFLPQKKEKEAPAVEITPEPTIIEDPELPF